MTTKKVKSAGRYGVRYGIKSRKSNIVVDALKRKKWLCSNCQKSAVRRVVVGIWQCQKCGHKFAGRAYRPD